jgi:aspartate aminotransferase
MLGLCEKIKSISPSKTLAITAMAKSLAAEGKDVIGFGAGEPDFDTFAEIKTAAKKAIDEGFTKYTPESGTVELKQAIAAKFDKDNGLKYDPKQIVVSCGAKHSLYNICHAIINPGDEVVIISPYWLSYPEMVKLAGGTPKFVETDPKNGFKADPKQIYSVITPRTKAVIINSPSNPAGIVYNRAELEKFAEIAVSKKVYVISDEIYEKLIYGGEKHVSIGSFGKDIYDLTITVNGMSKAYSMTGWRIGYLGAPLEISQAVSVIQSHSTSNPTSISQKASLAALKMKDDEINAMRLEFEARRDMMLSMLDGIKNISYVKPQGAFYVYCDISRTGMKADDFATRLLKEKSVAVIPGESFGSDKFIRLSFALSRAKIKEGLDRIKSWVER